MRVARDLGGVAQLLPDGCDSLADAPYTFINAVSTALAFLSFEEYPLDERPPKRIWFDAEAMASHWERIKAKYSSGGDSSDRPIEGPVSENLAARDLIVYG